MILLILMAGFQVVLLFYDSGLKYPDLPLMTADSLSAIFPDSSFLRDRREKKDQRPFNPNFISDYKGYLLGMSPEELDRLHAFRKDGRYVNSAEEFGRVTGISDSLLNTIAPSFSFPDFRYDKVIGEKKVPVPTGFMDLNEARAEDLRSIPGIGPVLSSRIVRFRDRLGGFLLDEQLFDVYGLDEEVGRKALKMFRVKQIPRIKKIPLNTAGVEELSELVYLGKKLAGRIVAYRDAHGKFDSIEQLTKIEDFPSERIGRIKLYLAL